MPNSIRAFISSAAHRARSFIVAAQLPRALASPDAGNDVALVEMGDTVDEVGHTTRPSRSTLSLRASSPNGRIDDPAIVDDEVNENAIFPIRWAAANWLVDESKRNARARQRIERRRRQGQALHHGLPLGLYLSGGWTPRDSIHPGWNYRGSSLGRESWGYISSLALDCRLQRRANGGDQEGQFAWPTIRVGLDLRPK